MSKKESQSTIDGGAEPPLTSGVSSGHRPSFSAANLITDLIDLSKKYELRHGTDSSGSTIFVRIPDGPYQGIVAVQCDKFRNHLRILGQQKLGRGPVPKVVDDVIAHIEAKGLPLPRLAIAKRIAHIDGAIYIDQGKPTGEAVRIRANGVEVVPDPPVLFSRTERMGILPVPEPGGDLQLFASHFPSVPTDAVPALLGFIVACFLPRGAYPILILQGEHGCGKSMLTDSLRAIIDPVMGTGARASLPVKPEDLATLIGAGFLSSFDNASRISLDIADLLCLASTGGGYETRKLYTQGTKHVIDLRNPIIINSISLPMNRPDLLSRAVAVDLVALPESVRAAESTVRDRFSNDLPRLLGFIYQAVSLALRDMKSTAVHPLPRLGDAAVFATAAEPALTLPDGAIADAWNAGQVGQTDDQVDCDPVVVVLSQLLQANGHRLEVNASRLSAMAQELGAKEGNRLPTDFPSGAASLGKYLKRNKSILERAGICVEQRSRTESQRGWNITWNGNPRNVVRKAKVTRPADHYPTSLTAVLGEGSQRPPMALSVASCCLTADAIGAAA